MQETKEGAGRRRTFWRVVGRVVLALLLLGLILIGFGLYLASKPLVMHQYTLSNGEKTVVFQEMVHISRPEFLAQVVSDTRRFKREGYILLYEGVRGTPAEQQEVTQELGLPSGYLADIAPALGLVTQASPQYLSVIEPGDINADVTLGQILEWTRASEVPAATSEERAQAEELVKALKADPSLQPVARGFARLMLNLYLMFPSLYQNQPVMKVLLERRDALLAQTVISRPESKILIHYGAAHFPGWLEQMQQQDPRWVLRKKVGYTAF